MPGTRLDQRDVTACGLSSPSPSSSLSSSSSSAAAAAAQRCVLHAGGALAPCASHRLLFTGHGLDDLAKSIFPVVCWFWVLARHWIAAFGAPRGAPEMLLLRQRRFLLGVQRQ